ncbi:MAG: hypothetical protein RIB57_07790 [Pelagibacterium sp.]|uniref:hypothetical protein n=1 Tax=Pelagibacterium sp. TaxID=1967288 RepID=UPI0032EF89FE
MAEIVETVEAVTMRLDKRITALEKDDNLKIYDSIEQAPRRQNVLARDKGGLFRYVATEDGGEWRCIAAGIDSIEVEPTPAGARFTFVKSDGKTVHQMVTFPEAIAA